MGVWFVGCLVYRLVGWLVGCLVYRLVGWLVGLLDVYGKNSLMSTLAIASSLNEALENLSVARYHEQRVTYADFNGHSDEPWQATDNCGNVIRGDFQDLYESPQYEVIIRVTAPVKDKEKLCKYGVK